MRHVNTNSAGEVDLHSEHPDILGAGGININSSKRDCHLGRGEVAGVRSKMGELYRDAWNINKKQVQNHYGTIPSIYVHFCCSLATICNSSNQSHHICLITPLLLSRRHTMARTSSAVYCFFAHQIWLLGFLRLGTGWSLTSASLIQR
jgi:hypothetical protein